MAPMVCTPWGVQMHRKTALQGFQAGASKTFGKTSPG